MTADDDHSLLREAWDRLHDDLLGLRGDLGFGDAYLMEFADKADRVANLGFHLDAAVRLADAHLYAPSLAVTRTCLEHVVLDWLLFRGTTVVQRFSGVTDDMWAKYQANRTAGAEWTTNIVDWQRTRKGDLTIYRSGLFSEPDEVGHRTPLSIYFFLLEQYDGLAGPPSDQEDDGFLTREELRSVATENQARWNVYLRWSALLDNLVVNDLIDEADRGRLGVHYRFLSTFAHPVAHNQRELYGHQLDGDRPHYDHYSSELLLLYVVTLAALELSNFREGLTNRKGVTLGNVDRLDADLSYASMRTEYFWFTGTNPHAWDFHTALTRERARQFRDGDVGELQRSAPSDVPFPRDPLRRLIQQHASSSEMVTGDVYLSPWPRGDAKRPR